MYRGIWCFTDQLHVSALYIGHHQVGIINLKVKKRLSYEPVFFITTSLLFSFHYNTLCDVTKIRPSCYIFSVISHITILSGGLKLRVYTLSSGMPLRFLCPKPLQLS